MLLPPVEDVSPLYCPSVNAWLLVLDVTPIELTPPVMELMPAAMAELTPAPAPGPLPPSPIEFIPSPVVAPVSPDRPPSIAEEEICDARLDGVWCRCDWCEDRPRLVETLVRPPVPRADDMIGPVVRGCSSSASMRLS